MSKSNAISFLRAILPDDNDERVQNGIFEKNDCKNLILTDDVKNVNRLIDRAAFKGKTVINVDVKRPVDLALDIIKLKTAKDGELFDISLIGNNYGSNLLERILRKNGNKITFCTEESICRTTLLEILDNINLIRLNKPNENFDRDKKGKGLTVKKIGELDKLCSEYEKVLKDNKLYDEALAYKEAMEIIKSKDVEISEIISNDAIIKTMFFEKNKPGLYYDFIEVLFGSRDIEDILTDNVDGGNCTFNFKKCYGIFTEVYEVLKDIQDNKIKYGNVAILYTDDIYVKYIKMIFGENDINVNITSSYSALENIYLKLIIDILSFANNDFLYKDLKKVVFNPLIKNSIDYDENKKGKGSDDEDDNEDGTENEDQNGNTIKDISEEIIKKLNNNYLYNAYISNINMIGYYIDQYKNFISEKKDEYKYFVSFLDELIKIFDGKVDSKEINVKELYVGLLNFADKWTTSRNKDKNMIKAKLNDIKKNMETYGEVSEFSKAIEIIIEELSIIRFSDKEKDNEIVASKFAGYKIINRKNIYVIGLASKFNSNGTESPILLDDERKKYFDYDNELNPLGHNVQIKREVPIKNSNDLLKTVESCSGANITISTPYYDILDNMELAESPLYDTLLKKYSIDRNNIICVDEYPNIIKNNFKFNNDRIFSDKGE